MFVVAFISLKFYEAFSLVFRDLIMEFRPCVVVFQVVFKSSVLQDFMGSFLIGDF